MPSQPPALLADLAVDQLRNLAQLYHVSTEHWDWKGNHQEVEPATLVSVLGTLGVNIANNEDLQKELLIAETLEWRRVLPACVFTQYGQTLTVPVHVPHGSSLQVQAELDNGEIVALTQLDHYYQPRVVGDQLTGRATFQIPGDLPIGWHKLAAILEDGSEHRVTLAVTPASLSEKPQGQPRQWGLTIQLYSVMSPDSWGMGDFGDLADLLAIAGGQGADFVLTNPLQACEPCEPVTPSPYLPASRKFLNTLYIRPEAIKEIAYLPSEIRQKIANWAAKTRKRQQKNNRIDRDHSWSHKKRALELIYSLGLSPARQIAFDNFCKQAGSELQLFTRWCALYERFGGFEFPAEYANPQALPAELVDPELVKRQRFYAYLQWIADEQLAYATDTGKEAGMRIGLMQDLAVGINPHGADAWSSGAVHVREIEVGAPPDMYNSLGQNWSQPPFHPGELRELGYAPLRSILRTMMRRAGAVRIDHVMGLFRLWWIPKGQSAAQGTYVHYQHEETVGTVLLEAYLNGCVVIGEDLGTVEPWVRDYLSQRGILGTSVLWFEKNGQGQFLHPGEYRVQAFSTVNTHDLPPTAGYLTDAHIILRDRLGILDEPLEQALENSATEREDMAKRLQEYGFLSREYTISDYVVALHKYVSATPSRLIGVSLVDAVGDRQIQNQPGTNNEYDNWRIPLTDEHGDAVTIDRIEALDQWQRLLAEVRQAMQAPVSH